LAPVIGWAGLSEKTHVKPPALSGEVVDRGRLGQQKLAFRVEHDVVRARPRAVVGGVWRFASES